PVRDVVQGDLRKALLPDLPERRPQERDAALTLPGGRSAGHGSSLSARSVRGQIGPEPTGKLPAVHVRILYFASFRDAVGRAEEDRQVPEGTCVRDLWSILAREVPLFGRYPVMPPAAINQLYQPP